MAEEKGAAHRQGDEEGRILILFAGPAERHDGLGRILRKLGHDVLEIDTKIGGAAHDVTRDEIQAELITRARAGEFQFMFAAPPCQSYSVAHRPCLRSTRHPEGLPEIPREWRAYVAKHNRITAFTVALAEAVTKAGGGVAMENPAARDEGVAYWHRNRGKGTLWHMPCVIELRYTLLTFAQCQFAPARVQKWTTIAVSPNAREWFAALADHKCEHEGRHSDVAHGRDDTGASKAEQAAAYPRQLNSFLAAAIACAAAATAQRAGGATGGRVTDGPALHWAVRRRVEAARLQPPRFATQRLHTPEDVLTLHDAPMPGGLHRLMTPSAPRASKLKGRRLPTPQGMGRGEGAAQRPPGRIHVTQLYNTGVYEEIIQPWLRRAAQATRLMLSGQRAPKLETVHLPQEAMPLWSRGVVWDCSDPTDCKPVVPSTAATQHPGARQLDRQAIREAAALMEWPDMDIVDQVAGGGIEARSACPLSTVLSWHHSGFVANWQDAERVIRAEMADEWVSAPYPHLPFAPIRILPRNVIMQPRTRRKPDGTLEHYDKPRVSQDSSDGAADSVNAGVAVDQYGVELPTVQQFGRAVAIVDTAGSDPSDEHWHGVPSVRAEEYLVDATAAFRFCPMQHECLFTQCFMFWVWTPDVEGSRLTVGVCVDRRMAFGGRYSPNRFERLSRFVGAYVQRLQRQFDDDHPPPLHARQWTQRRRWLAYADVPTATQAHQYTPAFLQAFIDDFAGAALNDAVPVPEYLQHLRIPGGPTEAVGGRPAAEGTRVRVHAMLTIYGLNVFGMEAAPDKTLVGDPVVALGLRVSRAARRIDIPDGKRQAMLEAIGVARELAMADPPVVEVDAAARLVGRLGNISQVAPALALEMHGGYAVVAGRWADRARYQGGGRLRLRKGSAAWRGWTALLERASPLVSQNEGVELAPRVVFPRVDDLGTVVSTTDASGEDGFGGFVFSTEAPNEVWVVSEYWPEDIARGLATAATKRTLRQAGEPIYSMPAAELFGAYAVPTAARRAGMPGGSLIAVGDCQPVGYAMRAERSANAQMRVQLQAGLEEWGAWLAVAVPRELNLDADRLSHPAMVQDVITEAQEAGMHVHYVGVTEDMWRVARRAMAASVPTEAAEAQPQEQQRA